RGRVIEGQELDAGKKGLKGPPVDVSSRDGQRAVRVTVERALEGYDSMPSGRLLGQLERTFVGFGTGVGKIGDLVLGRQSGGEERRKLDLRPLDHLAVDHHVEMAIDLAMDDLVDGRVPVSWGRGGTTADEVDNPSPVGSADEWSFGAVDHEAQRVVARPGNVSAKEIGEMGRHRAYFESRTGALRRTPRTPRDARIVSSSRV